ncbi:hypothetical protein [Granulosicoccus antarcticus]|uniref:Lipoprotein n=1 Tax=Granulosicoccus antarcticus IMCC3135 TaxID=1192854 RepID=A0A2Z2NXC6_9GAMM|nr:hypothetical protein [Granulosicoccus antarcticus]ASJ76096.1 hypothetical protein IMCC3135_30235 [Granulosicoccus antarcticus IMCC3135]
MTESKFWILVLLVAMTSGCISAGNQVDKTVKAAVPEKASARAPQSSADDSNDAPVTRPSPAPTPLTIESARRTGKVANQTLDEISGLAVSRNTPGVLFALNDSGNPAQLYALSETGADLGHWTVDARNRDWEEMGNLQIAGKNYLVLGDTGDNRQKHEESTLYLVEEPTLDTPATTTLVPSWTIRFRYEDGPRNVEAFAFIGNTLFLISKEPIGSNGPEPSRLYELQIPEKPDSSLLVARHTGDLPLSPTNLESKLAAAVAGVDLNHPTALDFDSASNTAYLLTYRHVIRITKAQGESWSDAFAHSFERIYAHDLRQGEALAVVPGQSVWFTSEHLDAPLWALPLLPPS